jgi:hypothetical protein
MGMMPQKPSEDEQRKAREAMDHKPKMHGKWEAKAMKEGEKT